MLTTWGGGVQSDKEIVIRKLIKCVEIVKSGVHREEKILAACQSWNIFF